MIKNIQIRINNKFSIFLIKIFDEFSCFERTKLNKRSIAHDVKGAYRYLALFSLIILSAGFFSSVEASLQAASVPKIFSSNSDSSFNCSETRRPCFCSFFLAHQSLLQWYQPNVTISQKIVYFSQKLSK